MQKHNNQPSASLLLKGAAIVFVCIGSFITIWLVDKAVRYPEIRASQFGAQAPLWIPMALFVVLCTAGACFLFIRAAKRVDAGDKIYPGNTVDHR